MIRNRRRDELQVGSSDDGPRFITGCAVILFILALFTIAGLIGWALFDSGGGKR